MKLYKILLILTLALFVVWGYFGCGTAPEQQQQGGRQRDTTPPSISISANAPITNSTNIVINIQASDSGGLRYISVIVEPDDDFYNIPGNVIYRTIQLPDYPVSITTSLTLGLIYHGTNILQAYAVDRAGNTSATSQVRVIVDTIEPTAFITNPTYGQKVPRNFTVSGTARDAGVSGLKAVYLRVGTSGAFGRVSGTSSWSTNLNITTPGSYTIQVYAEDNAGNVSSTDSLPIVVDATPPTVTIYSPVNNDIVPMSVFIFGTVSDGDGIGVKAVYFREGSGPFSKAPTNLPWWYTNLTFMTPGTKTIQVYAEDILGNISPTNTVTFEARNDIIIQIDGYVFEAGWNNALAVNDPANDTQGGAGADITNMLITNDNTFLYVAVLFRDSSWYPGLSADGLRNILFISTNDMTGGNVLRDIYPWINAYQANLVPFDFFLMYNSRNATLDDAWGVLNRYNDNPIEDWTNNPTNWLARPKPVLQNDPAIEFKIKLSALGLNIGDNIKVGFSVVNPEHQNNEEYETVGTIYYYVIPMIQYQIR